MPTTSQYTIATDGWGRSGDLFKIRIDAYGCAGNHRTVERPAALVQTENDCGPILFAGSVGPSCACAMGDSMLRTSTLKASLSTVVNGAGSNKHVRPGDGEGVSMRTGFPHLRPGLCENDRHLRAANMDRVVMWDKVLGGFRDHTIKVVNQASAAVRASIIDGYAG